MFSGSLEPTTVPGHDKGPYTFILQIMAEHSAMTVPGPGMDEGLQAISALEKHSLVKGHSLC